MERGYSLADLLIRSTLGEDGILRVENLEVTSEMAGVVKRPENYPQAQFLGTGTVFPVVKDPTPFQLFSALIDTRAVYVDDVLVDEITYAKEHNKIISVTPSGRCGYETTENGVVIRKEFPTGSPLVVTSDSFPVSLFDVSGLRPDTAELLRLDLDFYKQLPISSVGYRRFPMRDNLCSNFWNYHPDTSSEADGTQERLLVKAKREFALPPEEPSGLFICGEKGVGKSHIAMALAKRWWYLHGLKPNYHFSKDSVQIDDVKNQISERQIFVLDDIKTLEKNSFERAFLDILLIFGQEKGGIKIYLTSNTSSAELKRQYLHDRGENKSNKGDAMRYEDRFEEIFECIDVKGKSYRLRRKRELLQKV